MNPQLDIPMSNPLLLLMMTTNQEARFSSVIASTVREAAADYLVKRLTDDDEVRQLFQKESNSLGRQVYWKITDDYYGSTFWI